MSRAPEPRKQDPSYAGAALSSGLRWAHSVEAADLATLQAACWGESAGDDAWAEPTWRDLLDAPGAIAVIAERGASLPAPCPAAGAYGPDIRDTCGFALARVLLDEAELYAIGVVPKRRRQGLARQLLRAVFGRAATLGAKAMFLEVAPSNVGALALYHREGFRAMGYRPNYYRRGQRTEAALIMAKPLTQV